MQPAEWVIVLYSTPFTFKSNWRTFIHREEFFFLRVFLPGFFILQFEANSILRAGKFLGMMVKKMFQTYQFVGWYFAFITLTRLFLWLMTRVHFPWIHKRGLVVFVFWVFVILCLFYQLNLSLFYWFINRTINLQNSELVIHIFFILSLPS